MSTSPILGTRALAAAKRDLQRALGMQIRQLRLDAGVTQTALGRVSGVDRSHLSRIEAGVAIPSLEALIALGAALGSDLSVRLYPGSGPRIHDRFQAPMVEALIRLLDRSFIVQPEVAISGPVRGVIDLVVRDPERSLVIACEAQSELRRLEETLRRAGEKADALFARSRSGDQGAQLLLLRSTADTRALANRFPATLGAAYPAATADVVGALRDARRPWPGSGVVWARVERGVATILDAPPRGVRLGRVSNGTPEHRSVAGPGTDYA
ncbi:MAG: cro/C1-type protein [Chloroflexi bacterium]|nr:cro/C1-type protein [Chloroflexota bacterium]